MNPLSPIAATDSLSPWATTAPQVCSLQEAPLEAVSAEVYTLGEVPYTHGLPPIERQLLPGYDSGVLCLLIGMFLLLAYNFRHYSTFLKNFGSDLLSVRRREDTFDVRTFSETGVQSSIVLVACLSEGIIINSQFEHMGMVPHGVTTFAMIGAITAIAVVYYLWQLVAYATVGYVFTDNVSSRIWMKGFNASQVLFAMLIFIPALIVLFNPGAATVIVPLGVLVYILSRILFICKGFRLFYDNFSSLIYFILYLCTLEIVPLVLIYRAVLFISDKFLE